MNEVIYNFESIKKNRSFEEIINNNNNIEILSLKEKELNNLIKIKDNFKLFYFNKKDLEKIKEILINSGNNEQIIDRLSKIIKVIDNNVSFKDFIETFKNGILILNPETLLINNFIKLPKLFYFFKKSLKSNLFDFDIDNINKEIEMFGFIELKFKNEIDILENIVFDKVFYIKNHKDKEFIFKNIIRNEIELKKVS